MKATMNPQSNHHCLLCAQHGGKVMRYGLIKQFPGSPHVFAHLFPCPESREEFSRPFIKLGYEVKFMTPDQIENIKE